MVVWRSWLAPRLSGGVGLHRSNTLVILTAMQIGAVNVARQSDNHNPQDDD
jgi:hypothetical protein